MKRMLVGDNFIVRRRFLSCFQVFSDSLVLIDANTLGIGADVRLVEDAPREQVELFFFERQQQTATNLCGGDNFVERNTPHLSLLT
jgi:hypothetical protein